MTTPLIPINNNYETTPVWSAAIGSNFQTTDAIIGGSVTLTARTIPRLLVLFYQIGNVGGRISTFSIGGVTPTTAAQVDGYYMFTTPISAASSTLTVTGTQSSTFGRSWWIAFELSGYRSATPSIIMTAPSAAPVSSWSAMTVSGMATAGLFEGTASLSVSAGTPTTVTSQGLEGGTYNNFRQAYTARGQVTYTPGSTTRYLFAAWK